ncbi:MAG: 3-methylornithyl-N6-L-lysine dehydrogenase PylD [Longimicrobiales bacterium]
MTRLKATDIGPIAAGLDGYDADLKRKTGLSLRQIACKAAGIREEDLKKVMGGMTVAAVPVSSGLGVIEGFSDAVGAIVAHLGFRAFVTEHRDVAGLAEGLEMGVNILMLADDERFVAVIPGRHQVVDNSSSTALGFVAGLEAMNGGLAGASVLILGCGPVGVAGTEALLERGASVALFDTDRERALSVFRELDSKAGNLIPVEEEGLSALGRYELIFDATNTGGFIESDHLTAKTLMAAPGLPCALTPEALARHGDRVLHDVLEIGTATMVVQAAATLATGMGSEKAAEG